MWDNDDDYRVRASLNFRSRPVTSTEARSDDDRPAYRQVTTSLIAEARRVARVPDYPRPGPRNSRFDIRRPGTLPISRPSGVRRTRSVPSRVRNQGEGPPIPTRSSGTRRTGTVLPNARTNLPKPRSFEAPARTVRSGEVPYMEFSYAAMVAVLVAARGFAPVFVEHLPYESCRGMRNHPFQSLPDGGYH